MPVLFDSSDQPPPIAPSRPMPTLPKKQMNGTLGAYKLNPHKIYFATQGKNEQIILFLRQHPITQLPWVLSSIILLIIPVFLVPFIQAIFPFEIPPSYLFTGIVFYFLAMFSFVYINFILWYYNVNIVTNKRVVDIDFIYLLVQEVTTTRITQVEDVTIRRVGVFAGVFDYGNVYVQTAGAEANIEFLRVPRPRQVSQIIIKLMGQAT